MSHIFVSYSRKDIDFAGKIVQALADNALDTWIDWKSIPKGEDWEQEIYRGIEEADAFLFLISPDSVASPMCNKEIAHAVKNGKRILPIYISNTDVGEVNKAFREDISREEISRRNYVFCRDGQDDFNIAIKQIRETIHTDYEWLKYHTELQVKALKWEQKKDTSRLLRGKELREAEKQLTEISSQEDPQPTKLQREYILVSRRNEERQRRQITIGLSLGLIILAVISIFAWEQRNEAKSQQATAQANSYLATTAQANAEEQKLDAQKQAYIAQANQHAAISQAKLLSQLDFASLLSIEAFHELDNFQTRSALLEALQTSPNLHQYLYGHNNSVISVAFSPDGKYLVSGGWDNTVILWDLETTQPISHPLKGHSGFVISVTFSPDGKLFASGGVDNTIIIWDIKTLQPVGEPIKERSTVLSLAFSPAGKTLASGNADNTIILWNVVTRQPIGQPLKGHTNIVSSVTFSPDGKLLASGSWDDSIILWNVETSQPISQPLKQHKHKVLSIAFNFDGSILASGGDDNIIRCVAQ